MNDFCYTGYCRSTFRWFHRRIPLTFAIRLSLFFLILFVGVECIDPAAASAQSISLEWQRSTPVSDVPWIGTGRMFVETIASSFSGTRGKLICAVRPRRAGVAVEAIISSMGVIPAMGSLEKGNENAT